MFIPQNISDIRKNTFILENNTENENNEKIIKRQVCYLKF